MLEAYKPVGLPRGLSDEEVGRRLYPEAYEAVTPVQIDRAYATMRRELSSLQSSLTEELGRVEEGRILRSESRVAVLDRQYNILRKICENLHDKASREYFSAKGWPLDILNAELSPQASVWHFFFEPAYYSNAKTLPKADRYRRTGYNSWTGNLSIEAEQGAAFAIRHDPAETEIRFRTYKPSQSKAYDGEVSGLLEWAMQNRLLYLKLEGPDVDVYLEGKATTAWCAREVGPAQPSKPFALEILWSKEHWQKMQLDRQDRMRQLQAA